MDEHDPPADPTLSLEQRSRLGAATDANAPPPARVGRYEVLAKLGEGGMGVVMLARDPSLGRYIAIKLLRSSEGSPVRLVREAQGLARLSHPNVVQVYELGDHDGAQFVAMEYIDGVTLRGWMDQRGRPWRKLVDLLVQCGRGLEAAHDAGLVHRDFKPANVMIDQSGRARVLDFGLIRADTGGDDTSSTEAGPDATHDLALTVEGSIMGTPAYMAPEQHLGRRGDAGSDQFAFCVVAFEVLFGLRPFDGQRFEELRHRVTSGQRREIPATSGVPRRVREAIVRGLTTDPAGRWPSMHTLLAELDAAAADASLREYLRRIGIEQRAEPDGSTSRRAGKLYGRANDLARLHQLHASATTSGRAGLVVVCGEAGIGKSTLVDGFLDPLAQRGAVRVATTKFDQLCLTTPLLGLRRLIEQIVDELLKLDPEARALVRAQLLDQLGSSAAALIEFVPATEGLLGPKPSLDDLGPVERRNRSRLALERFLGGLSSTARPLILVLDDLQWADPASIELLAHLLDSDALASMQILATARPRELEINVAASGLLAARRKAGALEQLDLEPLAHVALVELLADSLASDAEAVAPLATIAVEQTGGNPLFVHHLLQALDDEELLRFDTRAGSWSWSLQQIGARPTADSVVALLAERVSSLTASTRELLQISSCIGNRFSLATLAVVVERPPRAILEDLWPALDQALLILSDQALVGLGELDSHVDLHLDSEQAARFVLSFRHDRIQQAAATGLDDEARARIHAAIGRALLRDLDPANQHQRGFEIADQLNLGRAHLDPEERRRLFELDLGCGRDALRSSAYPAALDYLDVAAALLDADGGTHEQAFAVAFERARALYLDGRDEAARAMYPLLHAQARDDAEHRAVFELEIEHAMLSSDDEAGFSACRAAFEADGLTLPNADADAVPLLQAELGAVMAALAEREIASLASAPPLTDARALAQLNLLNRFGVLCYRTARPMLLSWAIAKMTHSSIAGRSSLSGYSYSNFAFLLAVQGQLAQAGQFSALGVEMARAHGDPLMEARTLIVAYGLIGHFHHDLRVLVTGLLASLATCIEAGDLMHASDIMLLGDYLELASGRPLAPLSTRVEEHLLLLRRAAPAPLASFYAPHLVFLLGALRGQDTTALNQPFDADAFGREQADNPLAQAWHLSAQTKLDVLRGDPVPLVELERRVAIVDAALIGQHHIPEHRFYACLAALSLARRMTAEQRESIDACVAQWASTLEPLAASNPTTYQPMLRLVDAARATDPTQAMDRFERALDQAKSTGALHLEALGAQLYAEFLTTRHQTRSAELHRNAAIDLYERWGATTIANSLRERLGRATRGRISLHG